MTETYSNMTETYSNMTETYSNTKKDLATQQKQKEYRCKSTNFVLYSEQFSKENSIGNHHYDL
jgi:hypothetical protein